MIFQNKDIKTMKKHSTWIKMCQPNQNVLIFQILQRCQDDSFATLGAPTAASRGATWDAFLNTLKDVQTF